MEKINRNIVNIYDYVIKFELDQKRQNELTELSRLRKKKKINFEEFTKRIINIYKKDLVLKKRIRNNKRILEYFYDLLTVVNENRWLDGNYQKDLDPISKKIRQIELEYGLKDDEYFPLKGAPKEIKFLNKKYDEIIYNKQKEVIDEFLSKTIKDFFSSELDLIHSQYLRSLKQISNRKPQHKQYKKTISKETQLMNKYYSEFKNCYKNKLYLPAVVMLGAAFESLLISKIIQVKINIQEKINNLYDNKIINSKDLYKLTLQDLIRLSSSLHLIPTIEYKEKIFFLDRMSDYIKNARNFVHPGKMLKTDNTNLLIRKKDVDFLHSIFQIIYKHK